MKRSILIAVFILAGCRSGDHVALQMRYENLGKVSAQQAEEIKVLKKRLARSLDFEERVSAREIAKLEAMAKRQSP